MSRMRWFKRGLLALLAIGIVVPVTALLYFTYLFDWNRARDPLSAAASSAAGRKIVIQGDLRLDWGWPVSRLHASGIEVDNIEGGSEPLMLQLESLALAVNLRTLLHGDLEFTRLELIKPRLLLEKLSEDEANWNFLDNPAGAVAFAAFPDERGEFPIIDALVIDEGQVTYRNRATNTELSVQATTIKGDADKNEQQIRFGGKGIVQGQTFSFTLRGGSVLDLRDTRTPYPVSASLRAGATTASIKGTITDPITMQGVDLTLKVQGENAADLFPLTGIALLPTPPYRLVGRLGHAEDVWTFKEFSGRMGDSDLAGTLTWDMRPSRPLLTAKFTSRQLNIEDLSGFIGSQPDSAGDQPSSGKQLAAVAEEHADVRVLPDVPLDISRLAAMDAEVDFTGVHVISKSLPVDDFHAHFKLKDSVLEVKPVRFGSGKGDFVAWLTINARKQPVQIDSKLEVRRIPLAVMLENASTRLGQANLTEGYIGGNADLAGQGASLREMLASADGNIGIGMEGGQVSQLIIELLGLDIAESVGYLIAGDKPVPIRCVIADFEVAKGRLEPRALVMDTDDTVVSGTGHIDLRDETLDLVLKPEPKDFSPLALRAPLTIQGTLKHPVVGVSKKGLLARGAVAALIAVVFPPALIAAFIEPGLGVDSQCKAMLADMAAQSSNPRENRQLTPKNTTAIAPK